MATKSLKKPVRKTNTRDKKTATKSTVSAKTTKKTLTAKSASSNTKAGVSKLKNLRLWHAVAAVLNLAQAVLILVLSNSFSLPVSSNMLTTDSLSADKALVPASRQLFDVRLAWLVASFLVVARLYHLLVATVLNRRYEKVVNSGVN